MRWQMCQLHVEDDRMSRELAICHWNNRGFLYLKLKNRLSVDSLGAVIGERRNCSSCISPRPIDERLDSEGQVLDLSRSELSNLGRSLKVLRGESNDYPVPKIYKHPYKDWQAERRHKLTASTFASAIGFWRGRRVQLWLEKIGVIPPFYGTWATIWNNMHEEEAIKQYQLDTGIPVMLHRFKVHGNVESEYNWLAASPDGVVEGLVPGLPSKGAPGGVLEIKCPFFDGDTSRGFPWSRIPHYYIPQAQGLMEILDRDWMDFYVWTKQGSSLFRIHRDKEYWGVMKDALSDFWFKHVQPAREACAENVISDPETQLAQFCPAARHENFSKLLLESQRIVDNSELLVRNIWGKMRD